HPICTSSTSAGSRSWRATRPFSTCAQSSSPRMLASEPFRFPIGLRTASTINASDFQPAIAASLAPRPSWPCRRDSPCNAFVTCVLPAQSLGLAHAAASRKPESHVQGPVPRTWLERSARQPGELLARIEKALRVEDPLDRL